MPERSRRQLEDEVARKALGSRAEEVANRAGGPVREKRPAAAAAERNFVLGCGALDERGRPFVERSRHDPDPERVDARTEQRADAREHGIDLRRVGGVMRHLPRGAAASLVRDRARPRGAGSLQPLEAGEETGRVAVIRSRLGAGELDRNPQGVECAGAMERHEQPLLDGRRVVKAEDDLGRDRGRARRGGLRPPGIPICGVRSSGRPQGAPTISVGFEQRRGGAEDVRGVRRAGAFQGGVESLPDIGDREDALAAGTAPGRLALILPDGPVAVPQVAPAAQKERDDSRGRGERGLRAGEGRSHREALLGMFRDPGKGAGAVEEQGCEGLEAPHHHARERAGTLAEELRGERLRGGAGGDDHLDRVAEEIRHAALVQARIALSADERRQRGGQIAIPAEMENEGRGRHGEKP